MNATSSSQHNCNTEHGFKNPANMDPVTVPISTSNLTQRIHFNRKTCRKVQQLIIIHFNGVLGDIILNEKINRRNMEEQSYSILLRYQAIEGLREIGKHYEVVLFSFYSEQITESILDFLKAQDMYIEFDAVYCSLHQYSQEST